MGFINTQAVCFINTPAVPVYKHANCMGFMSQAVWVL